jgi:nitrogen regulatory protein P-II 1
MAHKELLICIVNDPRLLDAVLEGFLENEITGATVLDSRGMANFLTEEIPIFTGLKSLFPGGGSRNHMVFSVMDEEQAERIIPVLDEICGHFTTPGTGFIFTVPVTRVVGFQTPGERTSE